MKIVKRINLFLVVFSLVLSKSLAQSGCPPQPCYLKYIKVNIHIILKDDNTGNFRETDDGNGNNTYNGYLFAQDIVNRSNYKLANNQQMTLPLNNTTQVCPINFRYELKGVYFHRDSELYNYILPEVDNTFNPIKRRLYSKYKINESSEINVFIINHDNLTRGEAIDVGNNVEASFLIAGNWREYKNGNTSTSDNLFNHEMGHVLGLFHTWDSDDFCNDTPFNPNLWCESDASHSNNVMDWNCSQNSFTPCQLDRIMTNLNSGFKKFISGPKMHTPNYCTGEIVWLNGNDRIYKPENIYSIEIFETDYEGSSNIVSGYWSQNYSGQLGNINLSSLYSFVSSSEGKIYRVKLSYGTTTCGYVDENIWFIYYLPLTGPVLLQNYTLTTDKSYQTTYYIETGSAVDNSKPQGAFETSSGKRTNFVAQRYISFKPGTKLTTGSICHATINSSLSCDPNRSMAREMNYSFQEDQEVIPNFDNESLFQIYPNPASEIANLLSYQEGKISIQLFNNLGEEVIKVEKDVSVNETIQMDISKLKPGSYFCIINLNQKKQYKQIIKF